MRLITMASCIERQRLLDEFESALNIYVDSLERSLGDPGTSGSLERHRILLACREALKAHCAGHGCDESPSKAKAPAA